MYGGLTVARSTYAHSGYSLYYQTRTYVEPLVLQEIYQPKVRHLFTEVIKLLDGRSRLPDLLSGIGSTMYASALYAYSDLAPVYLNRFHLKVSKGFVDKVVLEDTITSVFGYWRTFVEAIAFADHKFRSISKTLLDSIALDDIRLADIEKTLADKIAFVDFKLYRMEKTLAEVIALAEVAIPRLRKKFVEAVSFLDVLYRGQKRWFRETIMFKDAFRLKLNGFYVTWSKRARAIADWVKRDRPSNFS